jgi:hypothetical protein
MMQRLDGHAGEPGELVDAVEAAQIHSSLSDSSLPQGQSQVAYFRL